MSTETSQISFEALKRKYGIQGDSNIRRWIEKYSNFDIRNKSPQFIYTSSKISERFSPIFVFVISVIKSFRVEKTEISAMVILGVGRIIEHYIDIYFTFSLDEKLTGSQICGPQICEPLVIFTT